MLLTESKLRKIIAEEYAKLQKEAESKYSRELASDRAAKQGISTPQTIAATQKWKMMDSAGREVMKNLASKMNKEVFSGFMFKNLQNKDQIAADTLPQGLDLNSWLEYLENFGVVHR